MKFLLKIATVAALGMAVLQGQNPPTDTSGDGMLNGAFHFRHVAVVQIDSNGNPTEVRAAYGTITFDGKGNYSLTGTFVDNTVASAQPQAFNVTATYVIGGNGTGSIDNPLDPKSTLFTGFTNESIYGAVSQGIFIGSATEGAVNDVFIAIPAGNAPTNASFTTAYQVGLLDFTGASGAAIKNALFKLTPDGKGGLGTVSLTGQAANQQGSLTQTVTGATYTFNNDGSATLTVPTPSSVTSVNALFSGTRTFFVSADGNFVLGWTPDGFDIDFGVKAFTAPGADALNNGVYFLGGIEDRNGVDSYYGSYKSDGKGNQIMHQRISAMPIQFFPLDYGTDDQIVLNGDGTTGPDFNSYVYAYGDNGLGFVGIGTSGVFNFIAGVQSGPYTVTGSVQINPVGIFNSASFAPITASLAPGELITIFGTNLSPVTQAVQGGQVFPTNLAGVQVTINNTLCPIYYVSPGQISAIVPYALAPSANLFIGDVQVNNNGNASNTIQMFLSNTAPGIFSQTQNGIGLAAALHAADGALITPQNPVKPGEFISLYLTGLGTVTPAVQDGALGPSNPLSNADINAMGSLSVLFNDYGSGGKTGNQGTIQFAGLAPGLAGLYQINVQAPTTGLVAGDNAYVEIFTQSADVNQIQVPIGSASGAASSLAPPDLKIAGGHKNVGTGTRELHRPRGVARQPRGGK